VERALGASRHQIADYNLADCEFAKFGKLPMFKDSQRVFGELSSLRS
jgi:hypothetical protein